MNKLGISLILALSPLLAQACAADDPTNQLAVDCDGDRCDGFGSIRSLISDARKVDLGDLIVLAAGYATDELNDVLDITDYAGISLRPTEFYGLPELADNDLTVNNLETLVSGLAARFGDKELSTEVNRVRAGYLRNGGNSNVYFAESAFEIDAGLRHNWNFPTKGLLEDTSTSLGIGFDTGATLEARVISAYADELNAVGNAPLAAIKSARGFIFPRAIEDVRDMRPGESFALKGKGTMGINVGAGVPILIAEPSAVLSYNVVLTAGLRSQLAGQMDIQLLRLEGDEVVLDVGMEVSTVKSARIGLRDGWGISGLIEQEIDIAGATVDLGRLVERALEKELNKKLSLVSAEASKTNRTTRMSVARMRFHLNAEDPKGARTEALAQALKGDIRLAQALANRGDSGVDAEFDLIRSGISSASHAGIEIFGMRFFRTTQESEGSIVLQTPGGATSLIFETLHRVGGWFFASHGYSRTGLAGLSYDAETGGTARAETNLFISVQEGDEFFERDKMLDHMDGIIVALAGSDALGMMEGYTNEIQQEVLRLCPLPNDNDFFDEECNMDVAVNNAGILSLQSQARTALQTATNTLPQDLQALVLQAGDLKIATQTVTDPRAAAVTPKASVVLDYRLDDGALRELFAKNTGSDFQKSIIQILQATQVNRSDDNLVASRETIATRVDDDVEAMAVAFDKYSSEYLRLVSLEGAKISTLGEIGANAIEIRFDVDSRKRVDYDDAVSRSISQARSEVAVAFFDEMVDLADDIGRSGTGSAPHEEQVVAYGLLGITAPNRLDLRVDVDVDTSFCGLCFALERYDSAGVESYDVRAKGDDVQPIGGGLFNIDALIKLN